MLGSSDIMFAKEGNDSWPKNCMNSAYIGVHNTVTLGYAYCEDVKSFVAFEINSSLSPSIVSFYGTSVH